MIGRPPILCVLQGLLPRGCTGPGSVLVKPRELSVFVQFPGEGIDASGASLMEWEPGCCRPPREECWSALAIPSIATAPHSIVAPWGAWVRPLLAGFGLAAVYPGVLGRHPQLSSLVVLNP